MERLGRACLRRRIAEHDKILSSLPVNIHDIVVVLLLQLLRLNLHGSRVGNMQRGNNNHST
jgi:hypothetical protein